MKKLNKKLSLNTQTLALLSNADLRQIAGGGTRGYSIPNTASAMASCATLVDCQAK